VHGLHVLAVELAAQVGDNVGRVEVGDVRAPPRADAVRAVDEHHREHGDVPVAGERVSVSRAHSSVKQEEEDRAAAAPARFDALPVVVEVIEDGVVGRVEHVARHLGDVGEDVPRARRVLAALEARAELAVGVEQVEVVGPDKVLREADDGPLERYVAVVVRRVLRDVARQLADLRGRGRARRASAKGSLPRRPKGEGNAP